MIPGYGTTKLSEVCTNEAPDKIPHNTYADRPFVSREEVCRTDCVKGLLGKVPENARKTVEVSQNSFATDASFSRNESLLDIVGRPMRINFQPVLSVAKLLNIEPI